MKLLKRLVMVLALGLGMLQTALADDEFYGVLEKRPAGKVGTWVVSGKALKVTKKTELEADHGALKAGACVEVEIDEGHVESIETEPKKKCRR